MTHEIPPPPLPARPTEPPSGVYRAMDRDALRLQLGLLAERYVPQPVEPRWWKLVLFAIVVGVGIVIING